MSQPRAEGGAEASQALVAMKKVLMDAMKARCRGPRAPCKHQLGPFVESLDSLFVWAAGGEVMDVAGTAATIRR
jgi:hypothetical protein